MPKTIILHIYPPSAATAGGANYFCKMLTISRNCVRARKR
jgi:hypothetical protein